MVLGLGVVSVAAGVRLNLGGGVDCPCGAPGAGYAVLPGELRCNEASLL